MKIISFDGHTFGTDYSAVIREGGAIRLPGTPAQLVQRLGAWPLVSGIKRPGHRIILGISIMGTSVETLRGQLFQWFDSESETTGRLVAQDDDGSDERYVDCICESLTAYGSGDSVQPSVYIAQLAVHGDVRWRATSDTSDAWSITASGQTHAITNGGTETILPVFRIKPTSSKTGGYTYKCHIHILWNAINRGTQYPMAITLNTATLVGAGKMQADGDDLRVYIDGVETYRWLDAMNSAATKIWFNSEWMPKQAATLKTAIAGSGSITSIELNENISGFPEAGAVYIGSEAFMYTARDLELMKFTGVTRAARGTSMAAHSIGAAVTWLQHDVTIAYGNATASAPTVDDDYKPAFELDHSTNTSWVYEVFGDSDNKRAARWINSGAITVAGNGGCYTGPVGIVSPYTVMGAWIASLAAVTYGWMLENPCGITNAAWSNGQVERTSTLALVVHMRHWVRNATWWTDQYDVPNPAAEDAWEAWSYSGAAFSTSDWIAMLLYFRPGSIYVADVTITLNSSETPTITVGAEGGNYTLSATLTNTTTGDAIQINFDMALNQEIEIDTYNRTVTYLADNSNQFQALSLSGGARQNWLPLAVGSNTLQFDDTGTAAVTLTTVYKARYY